jgi:hypothetical protein
LKGLEAIRKQAEIYCKKLNQKDELIKLIKEKIRALEKQLLEKDEALAKWRFNFQRLNKKWVAATEKVKLLRELTKNNPSTLLEIKKWLELREESSIPLMALCKLLGNNYKKKTTESPKKNGSPKKCSGSPLVEFEKIKTHLGNSANDFVWLRECFDKTDRLLEESEFVGKAKLIEARKEESAVMRKILEKKEEFSQCVLMLLSDITRYDHKIDNLLDILVREIDEKRFSPGKTSKPMEVLRYDSYN